MCVCENLCLLRHTEHNWTHATGEVLMLPKGGESATCTSEHVCLPVSGSLKSGRVMALSCRLSAMALSSRLLPRPESLPQTRIYAHMGTDTHSHRQNKHLSSSALVAKQTWCPKRNAQHSHLVSSSAFVFSRTRLSCNVVKQETTTFKIKLMQYKKEWLFEF